MAGSLVERGDTLLGDTLLGDTPLGDTPPDQASGHVSYRTVNDFTSSALELLPAYTSIRPGSATSRPRLS